MQVTTNRSVSRSVKESVNESVNRSVNGSVKESVSEQVGSQWVKLGQSVKQRRLGDDFVLCTLCTFTQTLLCSLKSGAEPRTMQQI